MAYRKKLHYKGVPVNMFGIPDFSSGKKKETKKSEAARGKRRYLNSFSADLSESLPKNLLVIYDIKEARKKERDWFRRQLINLNFVMIQKSVWVGPSPLPKDFLSYLKLIDLKNDFKTFKLAKSYEIQSTL